MPDLSLTHLYQPPRVTSDSHPPPLLVLLHGIGSNEQDLFGLAAELDPRFAVASARAPHTRFPGSYAWFEVQMLGDGEFLLEMDMCTHSRQLLARFAREAADAYGADPARVYFAGFSQGAIMSLSVMLTRPDLLAGVAAMSGRLPAEVRPLVRPAEELAAFPVLLVHGVHDPVIALRHAQQARAFLGTLPVELTYQEFPMGHEVSGPSLGLVSNWLTSHLGRPPA